MCEIFGFSSSKEEELNDYLKEFYSHCEEHPHKSLLKLEAV